MVDYYNYKMSGSEEEPEAHMQSGMSKAELRRSNKPIMEKRRRARINQCLDELKSLILEAMKKDPTRHSKLEKADILEMTVKHLQTVQRQQLSTAVATDPAVLTKFRTGFSECATEVSRYVSHLENVDPVVKQRLVSHLNNCVSNLQQMAPFYSHYVPYMPERLYPEVKVGFQSDFQNGDENNNGSARIQIPNGVQLIPSRLPTGELALLVPQSAAISANFPFFPPVPEAASKIGQSSAFTAVNRPQSPLLSPSTSTSSFGDESHQSEHYPQAHSPNQERRFKIPEQSPASSKSFTSSPETQKPQISSTSDSKSPVPVFMEPKADANYMLRKEVADSSESLNSNGIAQNLRQPLSVITDKTYNRSNPAVSRRETMKRHHSDGLLVISDKRPRYQESISSTVPKDSSNAGLKSVEDHGIPVEDLSGRATCSTNRNSNPNPMKFAAVAGPSGANGDMWRPW
ncbi:PREDICTED: transcription factor HES-4-B-like [Dufourea novaeangliae]|uniref:Protein deadpan n=1 Tax=Dufourea novaeangliae TaxID=178035 RepID=A0A154PRZ7_DUFNO|nr:PREDICTED: transcription factor HES-4-B-like [Dufourea novaeangliae]KZC14679.1 Protein deadpan [Dufourea novaeangliae]